MARPAPDFQTFLRAVHRRLVLVRAAEHAGLGALAGCAAGALFIPLMLLREQPALGAIAALLALGALAGLLWGITHRPSLLAAAMEADRQLRLHDLLSTAVTVGAAADGWYRTVVAVADERCRGHAPSQVVLRRYGSRAWGGIGLAASLVLTLSALLSPPGSPTAVAARGPGEATIEAEAERLPPADTAPISSRLVPGAVAAPSHDNRAPDPPAGDDPVRADPDHPTSKEAAGESDRRSRATGRDGQGGGAGTTADRRALSQRAPLDSFARPPGSSIGAARGNAALAGGGAQASGLTSGTGAEATTGSATSVTRDSSARAAPWESSTWPADARAAREAADSGRVPDAYRDLVREYFDR